MFFANFKTNLRVNSLIHVQRTTFNLIRKVFFSISFFKQRSTHPCWLLEKVPFTYLSILKRETKKQQLIKKILFRKCKAIRIKSTIISINHTFFIKATQRTVTEVVFKVQRSEVIFVVVKISKSYRTSLTLSGRGDLMKVVQRKIQLNGCLR